MNTLGSCGKQNLILDLQLTSRVGLHGAAMFTKLHDGIMPCQLPHASTHTCFE